MAVQVTRHRFTTADYRRMGEAGVLGEDDRVELIDGEIIELSPIGGRHVGSVNRLTRLFSRGVGDAAIVAVQNPIEVSEYSEPKPDLALLRPRADFYAGGHPTPEEIFLAVEVADSSAEYDGLAGGPGLRVGGAGDAGRRPLGSRRSRGRTDATQPRNPSASMGSSWPRVSVRR